MSAGDEPIRNVSDTAIWVAMYRAQESERPDALFRDPYARRLAGERGERIIQKLASGRRLSWPMVVRTVVFDEFVMKATGEFGADTVLNLATGLDTRPWRLPLPATLRWVDVDLPDILGYKQRELANETPRCRYEARAVDLRDETARRALFADVGAASRRTLVVTEGLLIYLPPESVAALARDLAAEASFRWWAFDIVSPRVVERMNRSWGAALARGNAPFLFAPASSTRFFIPYGWRELQFRSMWEDSKRLNRKMPGSWWWELVARFMPPDKRRKLHRFAGNVLLASTTPERV